MFTSIAFTLSIVFNLYLAYKLYKVNDQYKNEKIKFTASKDYIEHLLTEVDKSYAGLAKQDKKTKSTKKSK